MRKILFPLFIVALAFGVIAMCESNHYPLPSAIGAPYQFEATAPVKTKCPCGCGSETCVCADDCDLLRVLPYTKPGQTIDVADGVKFVRHVDTRQLVSADSDALLPVFSERAHKEKWAKCCAENKALVVCVGCDTKANVFGDCLISHVEKLEGFTCPCIVTFYPDGGQLKYADTLSAATPNIVAPTKQALAVQAAPQTILSAPSIQYGAPQVGQTCGPGGCGTSTMGRFLRR